METDPTETPGVFRNATKRNETPRRVSVSVRRRRSVERWVSCWLGLAQKRMATQYNEGVCLGGGFKYFLFSPLPGEESHFDEYFSNGLKPPTSCSLKFETFVCFLVLNSFVFDCWRWLFAGKCWYF